MAKNKRPIRIMKRDEEEYKRLNRNMKAKQRRINKKFGIIVDTPETPSLSDFKTRSEFNQWKEDVQQFNSRSNRKLQFKKNENGVLTNMSELNQIDLGINKVNSFVSNKMKEIDNVVVRLGGKPIMSRDTGKAMSFMERAVSRKTQLESGLLELNKIPFNEFKTQAEFDRYSKDIRKRSQPDYYKKRFDLMKENYKDMLKNVFGSASDELLDAIDKMDSFQLYKMTLTNLDTTFEYLYEESAGDLNERVQKLTDSISIFNDVEKSGKNRINPIKQVSGDKKSQRTGRKYKR